ncbi:MAG TPA: iron-sulfur cluster assembly scaffold protein [Pyrinomonadaceae bacterium]|mgnify:CR=1 FL=1|nr:iron-sulfur cluster assembly scaffold protein [Pyrinomonadaceae bacterium]HMP65066.1 iron-sulfur cluster assembly scaffold protein [Pyrinomonadaceae bacterium]
MCNNSDVGVYPEKVARRARAPKNVGSFGSDFVYGRAASFECGAAMVIELRIAGKPGVIEAGRFRTSGCGYMVATAELLISYLKGRQLTDLHSLPDDEIMTLLSRELDIGENERTGCRIVVLEALRGALALHRETVVSRYQGDSPLVCSCFGVSEEVIAEAIRATADATIATVGEKTKAGTGCGSCQLVLQSLIDTGGYPG